MLRAVDPEDLRKPSMRRGADGTNHEPVKLFHRAVVHAVPLFYAG